jgi:hypothetical protein
MRFRRWVFNREALASLDLSKLNKTRIEAWRNEMAKTPVVVNRDKRAVPITRPRSAASVNRDIAALRAALNFAHDAGSVTTDMAWRVALRPSKNADGRRDVYLDRGQRKSLIAHAALDVSTLLRGLALVPLRPALTYAFSIGSDRGLKADDSEARIIAGRAKRRPPINRIDKSKAEAGPVIHAGHDTRER